MASGGGYVDIPNGYPLPSPPTWKKKDRYDEEKMKAVDAKVKEVKLGNETYKQLAGKLTDDYETDLEKVRAIFTWLGGQDKDSITRTQGTGKSNPREYLEGLFGEKIGFKWTEILTKLCRAANLPCVVISGNCKGASYEMGQQDVSDIRSSWNCAFVDESWQIIHPHWAFISLSKHNTGRWTKIETEGKPTREKGEESEGTTIRHINEDYFCPDPEEFINKCIADKKEWQLLKEPMDVHTFCNVPRFEFAYFSSNFKLTSAHDAILKSVDGKCEVELEEKEKTRYHLRYELFFDEKSSKEELPDEGLPRYIFYETNGSKLRLLIRFRLIGIYKLSITAGFKLFDICLDATEKSKNEDCFPVNPRIGFGYGHAVEQFGIIEPTHRPGVVVMQQNQVEDFSFKMVPVTNILVRMRHVRKDSASLSRYIKTVVKDNNVTIKATMPDREEYALQVYRETEREENNILNYLLTSSKKDFQPLKKKKLSKNEKNINEARGQSLLDDLRAAIQANTIDKLEHAINAYRNEELPNNDELREAVRVLVELYENAVSDFWDDLGRLEDLLTRARRSTVAWNLKTSDVLIKAAAHLRLGRSKLLKLDKSVVNEIQRYKQPKPITMDIMKCTCILLGEDPRNLRNWTDIRKQLKQTRDIIQQMKSVELAKLNALHVDSVCKSMERYKLDDAKEVSAGLVPFFQWVKEVIAAATCEEDVIYTRDSS